MHACLLYVCKWWLRSGGNGAWWSRGLLFNYQYPFLYLAFGTTFSNTIVSVVTWCHFNHFLAQNLELITYDIITSLSTVVLKGTVRCLRSRSSIHKDDVIYCVNVNIIVHAGGWVRLTLRKYYYYKMEVLIKRLLYFSCCYWKVLCLAKIRHY